MTQDQWLALVTPANIAVFNVLLIVLVVWSLIWKGFALWRAASRGDKVWFIVLMILNTVGLLEILYLYVFSKREAKTPTEEK